MKKIDMIEYSNNIDVNTKIKIANECLLVANNAKFPTDFKDVYDHLFENDDYIKLFIRENENIKGFIIGCLENGYAGYVILHIHGIIIDPSLQGKNISKIALNSLVQQYRPDVVTAKTHNPRCFNAIANLTTEKCQFYPDGESEIPEIIYNIVKSDQFIDCVDEKLVYRNAYPDEKIMQEYHNGCITKIFENVEKYDAQAIVVVINNKILEEVKCKKLEMRKLN